MFQRVKTLPDYQGLISDRADATEAMTPAQLERISRKLVRNGFGEFVDTQK